MRIGLLSNLRAGRSEQRTSRLLNFLKAYPDVVSVETTAAAAVPEALADLARQEVSVLVVNGGDGTLTHTLTEILGNRTFGDRVPILAPLRGGRTNMSANDLGAHKDPVRGLDLVIRAVQAGRIEERISTRRVLRVAHGTLGQAQYGMFFGVGTIHRAIRVAHRHFRLERARAPWARRCSPRAWSCATHSATAWACSPPTRSICSSTASPAATPNSRC